MKGLLPWMIPLILVSRGGARSWRDEVIYFVMTDRFHDGDPSNNTPEGCDPELDDPAQEDIDRYHGGDLRGLELALQAHYFRELGVTTLWITPPVRNAWRSGDGAGGWRTGYHGYWAQDFLDIDPHLTSAVALNGRVYPPGAEGRMEHYRDFVKRAHRSGLKVIQDAVMNHVGPNFYYDADGDGAFDLGEDDEWVQPFRREGHYRNARWAEVPQWNLARTAPSGPVELLGRVVPTRGILAKLPTYGRKGCSRDSLGKSDGEEVMCDIFSLRDLWTAPDSAHFDQLVDELVEIYAFYLLDVGLDGLRIDTVKHVHHEFWDAFTGRLRERLGEQAADKILFGEVYDGNPARLGQYTWRSDAPEDPSPCFDSVLAFRLCFAMRDYLRHPGVEFGDPAMIEGAMNNRLNGRFEDGRPFFNPTPGPDGLNSRDKSITFIENHDGLNRFRADGVSARRHRLAQAMVMTMPGIPCLYYGAEVALQDTKGKLGEDGESGRMTLWKRGEVVSMSEELKNPTFAAISRLTKARQEHAALREGGFSVLWADRGERSDDDGVFAFERPMEDSAAGVVVVFNASDREARTGPLQMEELFPPGSVPVAELLVGEEAGEVVGNQLPVGPQSAVLFRVATE